MAGFDTALRVADRIDRANVRLAHVVRWGLLANAVLIAGNAFTRKLFSIAFASMSDVQPHFFAAAVLLMAAYTLQRDEHVRIDVFSGLLGPRGTAWVDLVGMLAILLPLCVVATWVTWPEFVTSFVTGETRDSRDSLSTFPAWIIKGMLPLGFFTLGLQSVAEAIRRLAFLAGRSLQPGTSQAAVSAERA